MKKHIEVVDCFIELIVYTLEFEDNSNSALYTLEKLLNDYKTLIAKSKTSFTQNYPSLEFKEALFPITAWIDEVILSSNFSEKKAWRKHLLQKKIFNTSNAGYEFFDSLKNLSEDSYELRIIYLYTLFLGFKGMYYREDDQEYLDEIFTKQKELLSDDFINKFPQIAFKGAYALQTDSKKKKFKASYSGVWITIIISLTVGFVLFLSFQAHLDNLLEYYNRF